MTLSSFANANIYYKLLNLWHRWHLQRIELPSTLSMYPMKYLTFHTTDISSATIADIYTEFIYRCKCLIFLWIALAMTTMTFVVPLLLTFAMNWTTLKTFHISNEVPYLWNRWHLWRHHCWHLQWSYLLLPLLLYPMNHSSYDITDICSATIADICNELNCLADF